MKKLNRLFVILLTIFYANICFSYDRLPAGKMVDNHRVYTLEEFKVILRIYSDYVMMIDQMGNYQDEIAYLEQINRKRSIQIEKALENIDILQKDRERLYNKWIDENKKRNLAENKPQIGNWISWSLAALSTTAAIILTVVVVSQD